MALNRVPAIYRKEVLDIIRDRRTLISMVNVFGPLTSCLGLGVHSVNLPPPPQSPALSSTSARCPHSSSLPPATFVLGILRLAPFWLRSADFRGPHDPTKRGQTEPSPKQPGGCLGPRVLGYWGFGIFHMGALTWL